MTDGYHDLGDVPLLEAYLVDRLPAITSGTRRFFGYDMDTRIYAVCVSFAPTALFIYLAWTLARLKRLWLSQAPQSSRFAGDLPFLTSSNGTRTAGIMKAVVATAILLIATSAVPVLLSIQFMMQLAIKGALHVAPLGLPTLEDHPHTVRQILLRKDIPSDSVMATYFLLALLDFGVSIAILWTLMRKKR